MTFPIQTDKNEQQRETFRITVKNANGITGDSGKLEFEENVMTFHDVNNNNVIYNDILLRTRGPYHRHNSTKCG